MKDEVIDMARTFNDVSQQEKTDDHNVLRMLDRGIDDMEAGRDLPLEEALRKISELRIIRRNARI